MQVETVIKAFIERFDTFLRHRSVPDHFDEQGREKMVRMVRRFVEAGQTIELLLPGFPHKNPNLTKVLGHLPDLGEKLALERLKYFCASISELYCPQGAEVGCRVTIFADGRVWGDLLGVSSENIASYQAGLRALPELRPYVRFHSLSEHFEEFQAGREGKAQQALEQHWESPEALAQLERSLGFDPDASAEDLDFDRIRVFERFTMLVREDRHWTKETCEAEIMSVCREAARKMMVRHAAFSSLLARAYPQHIRLSIHASSNAGPKYSIRLFEHSEDCFLPYHCTLVKFGERFVPMRRDEAEKLPGGVEVVRTSKGQPWYLLAKTAR